MQTGAPICVVLSYLRAGIRGSLTWRSAALVVLVPNTFGCNAPDHGIGWFSWWNEYGPKIGPLKHLRAVFFLFLPGDLHFLRDVSVSFSRQM